MAKIISIKKLISEISDVAMKEFPQDILKLNVAMMNRTRQDWAGEAIAQSSGWGKRYASTIKIKKSGGQGTVFVDENHPNYKFVNMVEEGVKSWNITYKLLMGKAARRNQILSKTGARFVRVPFRWRTPGKTVPSSKFTGVMAKDIYQFVKGGGTLGAGQFASVTEHMEGLKRFGSAKHGKYFTFRTVSFKTRHKNPWMYPAKPKKPVYQNVIARVEDMIKISLKSMIKYKMSKLEKI